MTRWLRRAAVAAALAAAGFVGGLYVDTRHDDVYCPSEDACAVDYDGRLNQWVVTPATP